MTIAAPNETFRSFLLNLAQISPTRQASLRPEQPAALGTTGATPPQGTREGKPPPASPVRRRTAIRGRRPRRRYSTDDAARLGCRHVRPRRRAPDALGRRRPGAPDARRRRDRPRRRLRLGADHGAARRAAAPRARDRARRLAVDARG